MRIRASERPADASASEVLRDATADYHDAGMMSGADACEHYLMALTRMVLWEFEQRHVLRNETPGQETPR